jgi:hypothetical protein
MMMKNINDLQQGGTLQSYKPNNAPALYQQQETASSAVAAQAKAMVEARYVMALQRPRIWEQVRQNLLEECKRPSFANNKSTLYSKPIGGGTVKGLGIRFVEVALRCMTNVMIETTMIFEDEVKEIHRVSMTDLESNITYPLDIRVSKTVERSKPMDDGSYISVRKNSWGKDTYTVPANDDDLLNKRGAQVSKAIRTLGLRIIPGDLRDDAEEAIIRIRNDQAAKDPGAERKKIADAFANIGVKAADLIKYLGHGLDTCSPAELVDLRGIWGAISDGEATWKTVMENRQGNDGDAPPPAKDLDSLKQKTKPKANPVEPTTATVAIDNEATSVVEQPQAKGFNPTPEEEAEILRREQEQAEADELAKRGEVQTEQPTGGRRGRGGNKEFNLGE